MYLLNKILSNQTWPIERYEHSHINNINIDINNNFQESFEQFGDFGLSSRSFSIYKTAPITADQGLPYGKK